MKYLPLASTAILLAGPSSAFQVSLWSGPQCSSESEGQVSIDTGSGCQTIGVGHATTATIIKQGDPQGNVVSFYSSNDCNPSNAIAEADNGCLDIDESGTVPYQSFSVIGGAGDKKRREIEGDGVAIPNPLQVEHGKIKYLFGDLYRWQQVADGAWSGIPVDEWNDTIHIKSSHRLDADESYPQNFSDISLIEVRDAATGNVLEDRDFLGTCTAVSNCAIAAYDVAAYSVQNVARQFVNLATAQNADGDNQIWAFLNNPYIVSLSTGYAGATLSGLTGAKTYNKPQTSQCSTAANDADAIASAIAQIYANSSFERDVEITITLANGASGTLRMAAYADGSSQNHDQNNCGAPADPQR